MDTERIIETMILEEKEVGLGKDNIHVISAEMTDIAVIGLDQIQQSVCKETELDASSVGNMIFSLKTVQLCKQKRNQKKYNKCIIWMKNKQC